MMNDLTERQHKTLDYLIAYQQKNDCPPTLQEIAGHLGITGNLGVIKHLRALERKGYLQRRSGARGIILTGRASRTQAVSVPIVGVVQAGLPSLAVQEIEESVATDPSWLRGEGCFYLRVKGDSMIGAHILDGDLALIRPQPVAENGAIVVALIDGEATLKRFFREKDGGIRLQAENPTFAPILISEGDADTVIIGKLLRTVRRYE